MGPMVRWTMAASAAGWDQLTGSISTALRFGFIIVTLSCFLEKDGLHLQHLLQPSKQFGSKSHHNFFLVIHDISRKG